MRFRGLNEKNFTQINYGECIGNNTKERFEIFFFSHFYYLVQYVKNQSFLMAFICFVGTSSVNVLRDVIREDLSSFYTHAESQAVIERVSVKYVFWKFQNGKQLYLRFRQNSCKISVKEFIFI